MKNTRYTDEQIAFAFKQVETGISVAEVIRRMGISDQTFYRWKKLYGGLGVGELRRHGTDGSCACYGRNDPVDGVVRVRIPRPDRARRLVDDGDVGPELTIHLAEVPAEVDRRRGERDGLDATSANDIRVPGCRDSGGVEGRHAVAPDSTDVGEPTARVDRGARDG